MLISFEANFPAKLPRAPGRLGSSTCSTSAWEYESAARSRAFLALFGLSTTTCTEPSVPDVLVTKARMFTLASPSTLAIWARVPGRFSQETVSCFAFGMGSYLLEHALYICEPVWPDLFARNKAPVVA